MNNDIYRINTEYQDLEVTKTLEDKVMVEVYRGCESNSVTLSVSEAREMALKILQSTENCAKIEDGKLLEMEIKTHFNLTDTLELFAVDGNLDIAVSLDSYETFHDQRFGLTYQQVSDVYMKMNGVNVK